MNNSVTNITISELPVKDILKAIIGIFRIPDVPPPPIDPISIFAAAKNPGLSPRKIASEIIARQAEAGAPFGPMPSGADNIMEKMEFIRASVYVEHVQQNAKVTVSVPPGIIAVGTVMSPVGPLPVVTTTTSPAHIAPAIIQ